MKQSKKRIIISIKAICLFLFFSTIFAEICDDLKPETGPTGYKNRGTLCEGFYRSSISSPGKIKLVSLIQGHLEYQLTENEILEVSSFIPGKSIKVRATGIPLKLYYRMDSEIGPHDILEWPLANVIYPEKVPAQDIGVYGWVESDRKIQYVPVVVKTRINPGKISDKINVYFQASVKVKKPVWRYKTPTMEKMSKYRKTKKEIYPAGKPIIITFSSIDIEDTYEINIEIAARNRKDEWLKGQIYIQLK